MRIQRIIVTGASSGMGKSICDALRKHGYHVIGISRSMERLEAEGFHGFPCDIHKPDEIARCIEYVAQHIGPIHGLINAAGVGFIGSMEDTSLQEAREVFETNTFGVFNMCRAVIPMMRSQRSGII
ncbi:MAG: SDR family NAD(P)-dependent oxidoreductase, partial [Flavobacteriales bacterium]